MLYELEWPSLTARRDWSSHRGLYHNFFKVLGAQVYIVNIGEIRVISVMAVNSDIISFHQINQ